MNIGDLEELLGQIEDFCTAHSDEPADSNARAIVWWLETAISHIDQLLGR